VPGVVPEWHITEFSAAESISFAGLYHKRTGHGMLVTRDGELTFVEGKGLMKNSEVETGQNYLTKKWNQQKKSARTLRRKHFEQ
jgi:hypothetical protein